MPRALRGGKREHPGAARQRKLDYIASREDRFGIPRDCWNQRDWEAQRQHEAEQRRRRADLIASMDRPLVVTRGRAVAQGFSLFDTTADGERQRRLAANRALQKAGLRPRPW